MNAIESERQHSSTEDNERQLSSPYKEKGKDKEQKQSLSELKEKAEELGVDFNKKTTKAELVELIDNESNWLRKHY